MKENIDSSDALPEQSFTECSVISLENVRGDIYSLTLEMNALPLPGQFFMLRKHGSARLLSRPISVFSARETEKNTQAISFLIKEKGVGTGELSHLVIGKDTVNALGPLGNSFPNPASSKGRVALIGGGIGVAPVAFLARTLEKKSYDFYASFKDFSFGLEHIEPNNLFITTESGLEGVRGMLPAIFDAGVVRRRKYTTVYACGPKAMLSYVKKVSEEAGVKCYLSLETKMSCGMGVCLGCTVETTTGPLRCCHDGPVFDAKIVKSFDNGSKYAQKITANNTLTQEVKSGEKKVCDSESPDLSVEIAGVKLKNPLIAASGTFGFGTEYSNIFDLSLLGAISSKGLTLEKRAGNKGTRLWETPSGLLNSIGLQNPGIPHFIEHEMKEMLMLGTVAIANLSGTSLKGYIEGAKLLEETPIPLVELNISCPNISGGGGKPFGATCEGARTVLRAVRPILRKPLIVKLSPESSEMTSIALSLIDEGADALSISNSFTGVAVDIYRARPVFDNVKAGFGGPAVRPLGMKKVYETALRIQSLPTEHRVPIIAIGGVEKWEDVVEYIMAGASAVGIGTATFSNPLVFKECLLGLEEFMKGQGYHSIESMRGIALQNN